jgi:hypothetical protein
MATHASCVFVELATKYELTASERLLLASCECAFNLHAAADLDEIARLCVQSRITTEQIDAHAAEIGVGKLSKKMVVNVRNFVQFFHLLESLDIVHFEKHIQGRTLLGYWGFNVLHPDRWEALLHFACDKGGMKYFGARSTVYEMLLKFGFKVSSFAKRRVRPFDPNYNPNLSTNKKSAALDGDHFIFNLRTLASNKKRLCNGQTGNKLLKLATLALKV